MKPECEVDEIATDSGDPVACFQAGLTARVGPWIGLDAGRKELEKLLYEPDELGVGCVEVGIGGKKQRLAGGQEPWMHERLGEKECLEELDCLEPVEVPDIGQIGIGVLRVVGGDIRVELED